MEMQTEEVVELKRYLLGELDEEVRWAVEERLFLDSGYLLQLQALEDELLDAYVYGDLPTSEQEKVQTELLSRPGRREDLRFAHALKKYFDAGLDGAAPPAAAGSHLALQPPPKTLLSLLPSFAGRNPLVVFSLAAAVLIIFVLAIWQVSEAVRRRNNTPMAHAPAPQSEQNAPTVREPPPGLDQAQDSKGGGAAGQPEQRPRPPQRFDEADVEQTVERPGQQPRQRPRTSPPTERKPSLAITVLLLPVASVREGGDGNVVTISSDVGTVNLQLPLYIETRDDSRYEATLRTGGKTIRTWPNLKPMIIESSRQLQVSVPVKFLSRSNYQVKLSVFTASRRSPDFVTYTFQVQKK